jgi:hypothetical protein
MAKKKGSGCLAFFIITIVAIVILFSNIFNFKIFFTFPPSQYFNNIKHFHSDCYCKTKRPVKIFDNIITINETKIIPPVAHLDTGDVFKLKGYTDKRNVVWIAVKVFKGNKVVYGYFLIPEKTKISTFWNKLSLLGDDRIDNNYFQAIIDIGSHINDIEAKFFENLNSKIDIKVANSNITTQEIKESKEYTIIEKISDENKAYYCNSEEYNIAEEIYSKYLGNNFETNLLQVNDFYNPDKDGVYNEHFILKLIDTIYFKVGFVIFLIFVIKIIQSPKRMNTLKNDVKNSKEHISREKKSTNTRKEIKIDGRMKVGNFKKKFKDTFGVGVRIYKGRQFASDDASLSSTQNKKIETDTIAISGEEKIGDIEKMFKEKGIVIQIENKSGGLANNNNSINKVAE